MKTKISAVIISLFFLMACGSSDTPKQEDQNVEPSETAKNTKFTLMASNNMYVIIDKDSMLAATEAIAANALIFEKVDQGNGKFGLKLSNGRFVCDQRNGLNNLIAVNSWVGEWEMFEIVALDESKINIKSSAGKFVCIAGVENRLYANTTDSGTISVFTMEVK